jgi:hypothetical protein
MIALIVGRFSSLMRRARRASARRDSAAKATLPKRRCSHAGCK